LGWEAHRHENELKKKGLRNLCFIKEDEGRVGFKTTAENKDYMSLSFKDKIEKGSVQFHEKFLSISEFDNAKKMKDELVDQLYNYCKKVEPSRDPNKPPKISWGGKSGYGFDDNVMALMMILTMKREFFTSRKYNMYKK